MLGVLMFEVRVDLFFVGGRGGLRRFGMGGRGGCLIETINLQLNFELTCFSIFLGTDVGLDCQPCRI